MREPDRQGTTPGIPTCNPVCDVQATRGAPLSRPIPPGDEAEVPAGDRAGGTPGRRLGVLATVAITALMLDVTTKVVAVATLSDRPPIRLLGGLLTLRLIRNAGAAFGIATGLTVVLTLVALGVVIAILRTAARLRSVWWATALGLLLGGAAGNLVDRLLRSPGPLRGHVVDWIELPHWPVFNVADMAIVCGGLLSMLLAVRGVQIEGAPPSPKRAKPDETRE
ncbi:MAG: signal peptidase II [Streptosporangiales bacterium]|nr:signal peptidase II [Streptosporangiales bacterium]